MPDPLVVARRQPLTQATERAGLTVLRPLAERAGIHHETVRRIQHGERTSLTTATALAAALDADVRDLFQHVNGDPLGGAA